MLDWRVVAAGLVVGFVVGLTGMGGGALMTPILVLLFKWEPLAAVSSDIVASVIMRPIGGGVHWRRGTVNFGLVKWLMMGSVPSAFVGVVILRHLGHGEALQDFVATALGYALLVVAVGLIVRPLLRRKQDPDSVHSIEVKPLPTLLVGIFGGLVVGMTSVGSGSLMMILLLLLYPRLRLASLVGTDLVQAVPLVASAAAAHIIFGEFKFALTASIVLGSVPGIYLGARFSSRAPDHVIRPSLIVVLLASGLKLLGVDGVALGAIVLVAAAMAVGFMVWAERKLSRQREAQAQERALVADPPRS